MQKPLAAEIDLLNIIISRNVQYPRTPKEVILAKFYMQELKKRKPPSKLAKLRGSGQNIKIKEIVN
jgi:hypothetical protein